MTVAIQGFGNAGAYFGKIAEKAGYKIVAASDSKGGILSEEGPFDVNRIQEMKDEAGSFQGYFCEGETCDAAKMKNEKASIISNDEILELDVDVLVLAALDGAIHEGNAKNIKASILLELANGP
ncbi:unnamed protein product, partial [Cyprideis torosa]